MPFQVSGQGSYGGYSPLASDAFQALLARMPSYADAAISRKMRTSDQDFLERQRQMTREQEDRRTAANERQQAAFDRRTALLRGGPPEETGAQKRRRAASLVPEPTAAQRAVSAVGGTTGRAYGDMARQLAENAAAGIPTAEYTGMTELARAGAGASQAAETAAGEERRQRRAYAAGQPYSAR